jgi:hypothetical protein
MSELVEGSGDQLRRAARVLVPNLPVLLVGSVLVAAGWALLRLLPPELGWAVVLGLGLVVLPAFAALLRGCEVLLADEHFGVLNLFRSLVRGYGPAVKVTALPTLVVVLTLLAADLWRVSHQSWMLASVGVGIAVSLVALYTGVIALPYFLRTGAAPVEGWLVSFYIASRNPVAVLAVLSATALVVWAAAYLSFALVLLLPAPLALVWAAAVTSATGSSQARLSARRQQTR